MIQIKFFRTCAPNVQKASTHLSKKSLKSVHTSIKISMHKKRTFHSTCKTFSGTSFTCDRDHVAETSSNSKETTRYHDVKNLAFPQNEFDKSSSSSTSKKFTYVVVGAIFATVGTKVVQTVMESLSPSADVENTLEIDLTTIPNGTTSTLRFKNKPIFIMHRTQQEIEASRAVPISALRHPASDDERTKRPEWLVVIGICTHMGCVPLAYQGEYGGWYCPCHGSQYDTSGRVRRGPAPCNLGTVCSMQPYPLDIPPYEFVGHNKLRLLEWTDLQLGKPRYPAMSL